jgi:hypothetical protein
MALPLISVTLQTKMTICEWVEMQRHNHDLPLNYEFIYIENSVPTTSGDQVTNMDRPGPSSIHVTGQEEKTRKCSHFPPNPHAKML